MEIKSSPKYGVILVGSSHDGCEKVIDFLTTSIDGTTKTG